MNDMQKLRSVLNAYDADELLVELFNVVKHTQEAQSWLDDVWKGYPEPEDTDSYDYMTEYERNPGWRNW